MNTCTFVILDQVDLGMTDSFESEEATFYLLNARRHTCSCADIPPMRAAGCGRPIHATPMSRRTVSGRRPSANVIEGSASSSYRKLSRLEIAAALRFRTPSDSCITASESDQPGVARGTEGLHGSLAALDAERRGCARFFLADGARDSGGRAVRDPAGDRACVVFVCRVHAGEEGRARSVALRQGRYRRRRGTGSGEQRRGADGLHPDADARHPGQRGNGGGEGSEPCMRGDTIGIAVFLEPYA